MTRTYSETRKDIFESTEVTLKEVIKAAVKQPADAHLIMFSPVFLVGALIESYVSLVDELGASALLGILPGLQDLDPLEIHTALSQAELIGACQVVSGLPEPRNGVARMVREIGRARSTVEAATALGYLVGSAHWDPECWDLLSKSFPHQKAKLETDELLELVGALEEISRRSGQEISQLALSGGLMQEDRNFLAVSTTDIVVVSALSASTETAALICTNPNLDEQILAMLAAFGSPSVRPIALKALEKRGCEVWKALRSATTTGNSAAHETGKGQPAREARPSTQAEPEASLGSLMPGMVDLSSLL